MHSNDSKSKKLKCHGKIRKVYSSTVSVHKRRTLTETPDSDLVHAAKALVVLRERKQDSSGHEKEASQRGLTGGEDGGTQRKRGEKLGRAVTRKSELLGGKANHDETKRATGVRKGLVGQKESSQ